jgi:hypothetical protein
MTVQTTAHLTMSRRSQLRRWLARQDRWRLASVLLVVLLLVGGSVREALRERTQIASEQPIIILATPALPSPPTVTPGVPSPAYQVASSAVLRTGACAVIGYAAPSTDAQIGAIEPERPYTPTERIDDEWLHAQVAHSGTIWLRPIELACLAAVPDIATPVPPVVPAVLVVAPARVEPRGQPTVDPPPTATAVSLQVLAAPTPTPWDSEAAREAEREDERRAWESVNDGVVEGAP